MTKRFLPNDWYDKPLPENVFFGEDSWLWSTYVFRHYFSKRPHGLSVGQNSGIYEGTTFDLGPNGEVSIGDYTTMVCANICTNNKIIIRDYVFIAHGVVLADSAYAYPYDSDCASTPFDVEESNFQKISIEIHNNAWIGMRAVLLDGAIIGEGAIVGAAAVVDFEVPPYSIVAGSPSKIVGRVSSNMK